MYSDPVSANESLMQFLYQAPIGLVQTTPDGEITMMNPMCARLLMPLSPDGDLGNLFDVLARVLPDLRYEALARDRPGDVICSLRRVTVGSQAQAPQGQALQGQALQGQALQGQALRAQAPQTLEFSLLRFDDETLIGTVSDATVIVQHEQKRLDSRLRDASRTDNLTSLPNRALILEQIDQALACSRADATFEFAVVFINADRFNQVNAAFGPAVGDELLRMMAKRMVGAVRLDDVAGAAAHPVRTTGRLGGDEFAVVLEGVNCEQVCEIAQRLVDRMSQSYRVADQQLFVSVSVGIVQHLQVAPDAELMLQEASTAMREAKRAGGGRFCLFEPAMQDRAARRSSIERDLRLALGRGELFVVYQPIVDLGDGSCSGVEALVRWAHPTRGQVLPAEFIGIAEETGLVGPLGEFVLDEACRQFVRWQQELGDRAPWTLSVNMSRAQLAESGLVDRVRSVLEASRLPSRHLQLEVTESLAAQGEQIQARLHELKGLGLNIALDDFGTGYSSLACLHLLPVDVVKIDRSFVIQAESSPHHRVLIEATVKVARSLGMQTVAEGIETAGQARVLAELQCDKGQGYLFGPPLPVDAATRWLLERPRRGTGSPEVKVQV